MKLRVGARSTVRQLGLRGLPERTAQIQKVVDREAHGDRRLQSARRQTRGDIGKRTNRRADRTGQLYARLRQM